MTTAITATWKNALKTKIVTALPKELVATSSKAKSSTLALNPTDLNPLPLNSADLHSVDLNPKFKFRAPSEFLNKIDWQNPTDPLLKQILPTLTENVSFKDYSSDPLLESQFIKTKGLIHKYKSRVLLIITGACAINCRYCFRREFPYNNNVLGSKDLHNALEYINKNPEINEVILSGGDPLIASDAHLEDIAVKISTISHITTLRIHTRIPIVMPTRINPDFITWITKLRLKVVIIVHANHPNEIDAEVANAINLLTINRIMVLNQSVLLKGVNDNPLILQALSEKLFAIGIMPYYLHLLDKVKGSQHFAVPIKRAKQIYAALQTLLPGYLVPKMVQEIAGKSSKTIIT